MNQTAYLVPTTQTSATITLTRYNILGSSPDATSQLYGVASQQVRIEARDGKFMLRNLDAKYSVKINDVEVLEGPLHEKDRLQIANNEFTFSFNCAPQTIREIRIQSKNEHWQAELEMLANAARTEFPVLLLGPSGTGKDILAQELHYLSTRHEGPFVSVNCSALTETLVESELFGHVKGAFTGAMNDRKGAFEMARGGTLFLDEIGDLPKGLQAKILRALENQEIRPVGSDRTIHTDVRIIAATHQNLLERIKEGQFRSDLYFRLNVVSSHPPALKERMEDFEELLYTFCKQYRLAFSFDAIQELKKHSWPGNIREVKNLVARASALFPKTRIEVGHVQRLLGPSIDTASSNTTTSQPEDPDLRVNLPLIKEIEKDLILKRLKANKGNQRKTAAELKMPKSTLFDRLKFYDIDPADFKV